MKEMDFKVFVLVLYGSNEDKLVDASPEEAMEYIKYQPSISRDLPLIRIELIIKLENRTRGEWQFYSKDKAIHFIKNIHKAL